MGDVVIVHLIRHAPTKENLEKRYIGWTDSSLADASLLTIVDPNAKKVYGSDLLRCRETAAHYFPNAIYVSDRRFRESNFGEFEGRTYEDLKTDSRYCAWLDDPVQSPPPKGEGFDAFCARVIQGFTELPKDEDVYHLVVHGGVIRALLVEFAPTEQTFWSYQTPHDKMFSLTFTRKAWEEGARCMSLSEALIVEKPTMS